MFDSQLLRVQREATPTPARRPAPSVVEKRRQPFEPGVRIASESAFGYDFSAVRVHADQSAAEPARKVGALAYTVGSEIVFGSSRYAPMFARMTRYASPYRPTPVLPRQSVPGWDERPLRAIGGPRHDFAGLPIDPSALSPSTASPGSADGRTDDVSTCDGNEEQSQHRQQGRQGGGGHQGAQGQVQPPTCPSKAVIEKVTDLTPAAIKQGWLTGYGALALVRVEPTTTDWDGTSIIERNMETSSTCPKEFGISPCTGADTFPVGSATKSAVLGDLPGVKNHFYDTHRTRWKTGSLLHDPARNPHGLSSCEIVCEQKYVCGGTIISTQKVKRVFTKGKDGSRDVTLVNVTIT